jgi:arylsulfatase A-like enzyme
MNQLIKHLFILTFISLFSLYSRAQNPNILLIIADDLGVDALNGYNVGSVTPTTPHLDSLRNSGVTFANAWSSPVCTPTRAGMMSGMYGSKNNVKTAPGNLDTTFTSLLKAIKISNPNYTAAVTGKWHIAKPVTALHPIWHGADHYMGVLDGAVPAYDDWDKTENSLTTNSTDYATTYFTNDAINWINNQNNPWFMWLAHIAPHTPFHVPPANMFSQPSTNSQLKKYMAMIESLDYEVGRLLDSLSPVQKANTVIIFIGDNGTPGNVLQDYPANHGKETLYQGGIHVPMFVSGLGVTRSGETETALVNVIDIYATVMELAGSNLPGGIHNSLSFKHLLSSSDLPKRQYNFSELDTNLTSIITQGYAIRDSTYKLIEYHDGQQELFNLTLDPLETNNLLLATLTPEEQTKKTELEDEANSRITGWSCHDDIKNGDETGIDCGGTYCAPCSVGIDDLNLRNGIKIFPNPLTDKMIIEVNQDYQITIKNSVGNIVKESKINSGINTISLDNLPSGMYFIEGINTSSKFVKKVIISK